MGVVGVFSCGEEGTLGLVTAEEVCLGKKVKAAGLVFFGEGDGFDPSVDVAALLTPGGCFNPTLLSVQTFFLEVAPSSEANVFLRFLGDFDAEVVVG